MCGHVKDLRCYRIFKEILNFLKVIHKVVYTGEPRPAISWFINNQEIVSSTEEIIITTTENTSTLTIRSFNPERHVGEIICKAENDAGEVSCTANMAVS